LLGWLPRLPEWAGVGGAGWRLDEAWGKNDSLGVSLWTWHSGGGKTGPRLGGGGAWP
jgi:hypothetical protein